MTAASRREALDPPADLWLQNRVSVFFADEEQEVLSNKPSEPVGSEPGKSTGSKRQVIAAKGSHLQGTEAPIR